MASPWSVTHGCSRSMPQKVLKDGSVLLCGSVWADSAYNFDIFLARLTPEGFRTSCRHRRPKTIKFYQAQDAAWDLAIDNEGGSLVAATNYNLIKTVRGFWLCDCCPMETKISILE